MSSSWPSGDGCNDATTVSIAATDAAAGETATDNGQFTVTLAGGKVAGPGGIVVNFSVSGTATPTTDYTSLGTSVTIAAGSNSAVINVSGIVDDNIIEGNETVIVTLTSTNNAAVTVAGSPATVTISDNDATSVSISANDATASETPTDNGQFTLTLAGGKVAGPGGIVVNFSVSGTATPTTD